MKLAHEFLQAFCLENQQNQTLLHQSLDLFLTAGVCFSSICSPSSAQNYQLFRHFNLLSTSFLIFMRMQPVKVCRSLNHSNLYLSAGFLCVSML